MSDETRSSSEKRTAFTIGRRLLASSSLVLLAVVLVYGLWLLRDFNFRVIYSTGTTFGLILIDTPEVYTRERLVNDRFRQDAWLREVLDMNDVTFGFEGIRSTSIVETAGLRAGAGADGEAESGGARPADRAAAVISPIDAFRDELAYREEIRNEIIENKLDDRHDLTGNTLYRLKFDTTIIPDNDTSAYAILELKLVGPIKEQPQEVKEFREAKDQDALVKAVASWLDEREIQEFAELYERWREQLGRDAQLDVESLLRYKNGHASTQERLSRFMREEVGKRIFHRSFEADSSYPDGEETVIDKVRRSCLEDKAAEQIDCLGKLLSSHEELIKDLSYASAFPSDVNFPKNKDEAIVEMAGALVEGEMSRLAEYVKILRVGTAISVDDLNDAKHYYPGAETALMATRDRLVKVLGEQWLAHPLVVTDEYPQVNWKAVKLEVYAEAGALLGLRHGLAAFIVDLTGEANKVYAYSVTPKERLQRISDATRRSRSAALGLETRLEGATAALDHVRGRESQLQAVRGQPLVVGFGSDLGSGQGTAGWLLGPRFRIPQDPAADVSFRQVPTQQAVSTIVSAPSWWQNMKVTVRAQWRTGDGRRVGLDGLELDDTEEGQEILSTTIELPGDPRSIIDVLDSGSRIKLPVIDVANMEPIHLTVGGLATVIILGRNLWRSAVVMLGAQRAERVTVLPDMSGVIATFDKIVAPANWGRKGTYSDSRLTVWTSEGASSVVGRVSIHLQPAAAVPTE